MKPMLARTLGPKFDSFPCYVQPKLNGIRALYQNGTFQSRGEKLWKDTFFPHLVTQLRELGIVGPILDGELYVHGWRLQRISSATGVNNNEPNADTPHIQYHVFDTVNLQQDFEDRWFDLYTPLQSAQALHIRAVPTAIVHNREELDQHFRFYTSKGYEGIMLRPNGPYEFGEHMAKHGQNMTQFRSRYLWKHKQWIDGEFVCTGITQGEGKADIGIGALQIMSPERYAKEYSPAEPVGYVGTGLTDEDRIEFMRNPPIGKLIKVRYLELTADGIPFNPSFLAVL